jgi:dynein heavy chain
MELIIATVSRCGMIYMEPSRLGYRNTLVPSWLNRQEQLDAEKKDLFLKIFDSIVINAIQFVRSECVEMVESGDASLVSSFLNILEVVLKETPEISNQILYGAIIFAIVWGIGSTVNEDGRVKLNVFLRNSIEGNASIPQPPSGESIYNFLFEIGGGGQWKPWLDLLPRDFQIPSNAKIDNILVPTLDTARYSHMIKLLASSSKHVLCVGSTGTGKTLYIRDTLINGMKQDYIPTFISLSAQTTSFQIQKLMESRFDKRRKGVYGPTLGKKAIIFIDDLSMPTKELYGAQPPIELVRQWMDHGGWYDLTENSFQEFVDIQFIGAMGPSGGGRNSITTRVIQF